MKKRTKKSVLTQDKYLTDTEVRQLLEVLNRHKGERDSLMIRTALFTAARGAEVVSIKKKHLGDRAITIYGKKHGNDRTVPVPVDFFEELKNFSERLSDNDHIFQSGSGQGVCSKTFRRAWKIYSPNVNRSSHSLRHTCAVQTYKKLRDIHTVKYILGHRSLENTMVYLDFVERTEKLRNGLEGMWEAA